MKAVVVGLGYVGVPLAVRSAEVGHQVLGLDVDPHGLAALRAGRSPVEDVSDDRLQAALGSGRLRVADAAHYTENWDAFDIGIITVPTPLHDRTPDLSHVEAAARTLGRNLRRRSAVVLESTTYPGTTENLVARVLEEESGLRPGQYHLGFSPERIDPGNPSFDLATTPKIVSGVGAEALEVIRGFYDSVVVSTVPVSSPGVAELAKLVENTFRHINIALVNELARISHELGLDIWEALDAAATKPYGFMEFTPGPGVGGHCIPVDPQYLAWRARSSPGSSSRLIELAQDINDGMPGYVVERAGELLNTHSRSVRDSSVLVLGVAYKKNVGDLRGSPALPIIARLEAAGARVTIADPHVRSWTRTAQLDAEDLPGAVGDFDLVIVVADHDAFDYEKVSAGARCVLDCRHAVPASARTQRL